MAVQLWQPWWMCNVSPWNSWRTDWNVSDPQLLKAPGRHLHTCAAYTPGKHCFYLRQFFFFSLNEEGLELFRLNWLDYDLGTSCFPFPVSLCPGRIKKLMYSGVFSMLSCNKMQTQLFLLFIYEQKYHYAVNCLGSERCLLNISADWTGRISGLIRFKVKS